MKRIWIAERLKTLGKKKSQLGIALSLPPSRVSEIINGKRQIQSQEIALLAGFLRLEVDEVVTLISGEENLKTSKPLPPTETILISGEYCPNNNTYQLWSEGHHYPITLPRQAQHHIDSKLGLEHICKNSGVISLYVCIDKIISGDTIPANGPLADLKIISEYRQFPAH